MQRHDDRGDPAARFADEANRRPSTALGELYDFLRHNKKWWLTPIVIILLLIGALVILNTTAAAPFIYTLF